MLVRGDLDELVHQHGRAVVDIAGFGEVEDHHLMILDVVADHPHQLVGGGDREAAAQRHQPDSRRERVGADAGLFGQERHVEQRHGDDAVEFQALQLACVRHPGRDQPDRHRRDQVDEHREPERQQHHEQVFAAHAVHAGDHPPVDDVPSHLHQDARQHGMRNRLHEAAQAQQQRQHHHRAQRARDLRRAAGADVDHRSHGGPRTGNAAEQPGNNIAEALADQLAVGVVTGAGHRVRHQRGKQAVHGPEQRENEGRLDCAHQKANRGQREMQLRQPGGYRPDHRHVTQRQHAEQRADDQGYQRSGHEPGPLARPQHADEEGGQGDGEGVDVGVGQGGRQCANRTERPAQRRRRAQKRQDLDQHHDDADARHEPGHHHVRRISHEAPDPHHAQEHLQQAAHHHHDERLGQVG